MVQVKWFPKYEQPKISDAFQIGVRNSTYSDVFEFLDSDNIISIEFFFKLRTIKYIVLPFFKMASRIDMRTNESNLKTTYLSSTTCTDLRDYAFRHINLIQNKTWLGGFEVTCIPHSH